VSEREYESAMTLAQRKRSKLSALEYFWPYLFAIVWVGIGWLPTSITGTGGGGTDDLYFELGVLPILMVFLYMRRRMQKREYKKLSHFRLLHQQRDNQGIVPIPKAHMTSLQIDEMRSLLKAYTVSAS
jgi:hypothetical protein